MGFIDTIFEYLGYERISDRPVSDADDSESVEDGTPVDIESTLDSIAKKTFDLVNNGNVDLMFNKSRNFIGVSQEAYWTTLINMMELSLAFHKDNEKELNIGIAYFNLSMNQYGESQVKSLNNAIDHLSKMSDDVINCHYLALAYHSLAAHLDFSERIDALNNAIAFGKRSIELNTDEISYCNLGIYICDLAAQQSDFDVKISHYKEGIGFIPQV